MMPPAVRDTLTRYLETVRPLLSDEQFVVMKDQAIEFEKTVSNEIQRKLWMKWLISRNYVGICLLTPSFSSFPFFLEISGYPISLSPLLQLSDWWKEVVYMRHRSSLIYTNVACADVIYQVDRIDAEVLGGIPRKFSRF